MVGYKLLFSWFYFICNFFLIVFVVKRKRCLMVDNIIFLIRSLFLSVSVVMWFVGVLII